MFTEEANIMMTLTTDVNAFSAVTRKDFLKHEYRRSVDLDQRHVWFGASGRVEREWLSCFCCSTRVFWLLVDEIGRYLCCLCC